MYFVKKMNMETMTQTDVAVKMILDRWDASLKNFDALLETLTDETLMKEITPGKNRGIYLLGHLIAVHDDMLILMDMGGKLYPGYNEPFIKSPDQAVTSLPAIADMRKAWTDQSEVMKKRFDALSTEDWFGKHMAVSAEDFAKEPHRNKLNIVLTRTTHLQYHLGQLRLLK
jgi:hypothetical protein